MQCLNLVHAVTAHKSKWKDVYICKLDIAKAFPSVPHALLYHMVGHMGWSTSLLRTFQESMQRTTCSYRVGREEVRWTLKRGLKDARCHPFCSWPTITYTSKNCGGRHPIRGGGYEGSAGGLEVGGRDRRYLGPKGTPGKNRTIPAGTAISREKYPVERLAHRGPSTLLGVSRALHVSRAVRGGLSSTSHSGVDAVQKLAARRLGDGTTAQCGDHPKADAQSNFARGILALRGQSVSRLCMGITRPGERADAGQDEHGGQKRGDGIAHDSLDLESFITVMQVSLRRPSPLVAEMLRSGKLSNPLQHYADMVHELGGR